MADDCHQLLRGTLRLRFDDDADTVDEVVGIVEAESIALLPTPKFLHE